MSKHTPGPWIYPKGLFDNRTHGPSIQADGEVVCAVQTVDPDFDAAVNDRRLANAYLIAAAPEMFAALEYLEGNDWIGQPARSLIEAALAKARGES